MDEVSIGDDVVYGLSEYKVLGFAASLDEHGRPLVELAWDNYGVSPTGYLAVDRRLLRKKDGSLEKA